LKAVTEAYRLLPEFYLFVTFTEGFIRVGRKGMGQKKAEEAINIVR